ncbi:MAG: hypothetical protein CMJ89_19680 [Planctomycetes bacterium]|nr:hypothetical protein [Planctomycetota bacterium]
MMGKDRSRSKVAMSITLISAFLASWAGIYLLLVDRDALLLRHGELVRQNDELDRDLDAAEAALEPLRQLQTQGAAGPDKEGGEGVVAQAERRTNANRLQAAEIAVENAQLGRADEILNRIPEAARGFAWHLLRSRAARRFPLLVDSEDDVLVVSAAPGRREVAVGTRDGWIAGYAIPAGGTAPGPIPRPGFRIRAGQEAVFACAYSPDGRRVAAGDLAGRVSVWSVPGGEKFETLEFDETVTALAFVEERRLAIGGDEGRLAVWNISDGSLIELRGHDRAINAIDVDRRNVRFATAGDDSLVRIWSGVGFRRVVELAGHADWVRDVAFASDGRTVSSASSDLTIRHWNPDDGGLIASTSTAGVEVVCLEYASVPNTWCALGHRGELLFERAGARLRYDVPLVGGIALLGGAAAEDLSWAVLAMGGALSLWRTDPGPSFERRSADAGELRSIASSTDGGLVVAGGTDGGVWVFDATGARRIGGHRGACMSVGLLDDAQLCASGGRDGTARIFELGPQPRERLVLEVDDKPVVAVALSEDAQRVACVSRSGRMRSFDAHTGELLREIPPPQRGVAVATIDRKATLLAWIGDGGSIRTWDVQTGERVHPLRDRDLARVSAIDVAEEGLRLACTSNDYFAHVYDLETRERLAILNDPDHSIWSLALDAKGETLATASRDGTVFLWDVESGERLLKLQGSFEAILSLEFRRDGRCLYAGTENGAIEAWEVELD